MKKLPPNATTWTAVALIALGLLTIFLAWNGAAGIPDTRAQFPYLISGGLGGVAFVGAGLVLVRTFEGRRDTQQIVAELRKVHSALEQLVAAQDVGMDPEVAEAAAGAPASSVPAPSFEQPVSGAR